MLDKVIIKCYFTKIKIISKIITIAFPIGP